MEHFVRIDVAKARDRALIEKQRFDRRSSPSESCLQLFGGRQLQPGIGPETRHSGRLELVVGEHCHESERARVDETDLGPVIQECPEMGMGRQRGILGLHSKAPRHPEVCDQGLAVIEWGDQKLSLAANRLDPAPNKPLLYLSGCPIVSSSPDVSDGHRFEGAPGHGVIEMTPGDLDFGELGHSSTPQRRRVTVPRPMLVAPRTPVEVVTAGLTMLARVWRRLVAPSLSAFIPLGALTLLAFQVTGANEFLSLSFNDPAALDAMTTEEFLEVATPFVNAILIALLLQILASAFISLATSRVVAAEVDGESITGGAASRFALSRILPLVGIGLISAAGVALGLVLLVIPGIWLAVSASMVPHVVALEDRGVMASLTRSIGIVRGRWWPTLGYLLLVGLMGSVAGWLLQFVAVPLIALGDISTGLALVFVAGLILQGLVVAAIAVMNTMWYFDLIARQEAVSESLN